MCNMIVDNARNIAGVLRDKIAMVLHEVIMGQIRKKYSDAGDGGDRETERHLQFEEGQTTARQSSPGKTFTRDGATRDCD